MPQDITPQVEKKFETIQPQSVPETINQPDKSPEILAFPEKIKPAEAAAERAGNDQGLTGSEGEVGVVVGGSTNSTYYKERLKKIEATLEKDLSELYLAMPDSKRQEFKIAGEETANKINEILSQAKYKVQAIITLIKKWLSMLPGVNQFFIEQETKIKTDEIIRLKSL